MKVSQRKLINIIKEEMQRTLKEFGAAEIEGAVSLKHPTTPPPAADPELNAEDYYTKIKGGDKDPWRDLRNAAEGDMTGVGDLVTKEEATALVLQIADMMVDEL
jgi:hypothetical protein|tara:strand:- start:1570 stop:1881 length:312 start_codon:yes stop_codon:yes gene_type:complete